MSLFSPCLERAPRQLNDNGYCVFIVRVVLQLEHICVENIRNTIEGFVYDSASVLYANACMQLSSVGCPKFHLPAINLHF